MPRGNRRTTPAPVPQPVNNDQNTPPTPAAVIAAGAAEDAVREAHAAAETRQEEQAAAETRQEEQTGGEGQGPGEGPAAEGQEAAETRQEEQTGGESPTPGEGPTAEGQPAAETPVEAEAQSGLTMTVQIRGGVAAEDIVATADVTLGDLCTIRNVKLKQDDYGLKVVMPRTKLPETGRFKDACYFHSPELREQFDAAVKDAYQQTLEPTQEQGGMGDMTM